MSVEQTTQLIALILNTVLAALLTALLWGAGAYWQRSLTAQLEHLVQTQRSLFSQVGPDRQRQLQQLRHQRQRLRRQHQLSTGSTLALQGALASLLLSLLLLALRMLVFTQGLIVAALGLFGLGAVGLLGGTLLLLAADPTGGIKAIAHQLTSRIPRQIYRHNRPDPVRPMLSDRVSRTKVS